MSEIVRIVLFSHINMDLMFRLEMFDPAYSFKLSLHPDKDELSVLTEGVDSKLDKNKKIVSSF